MYGYRFNRKCKTEDMTSTSLIKFITLSKDQQISMSYALYALYISMSVLEAYLVVAEVDVQCHSLLTLRCITCN